MIKFKLWKAAFYVGKGSGHFNTIEMIWILPLNDTEIKNLQHSEMLLTCSCPARGHKMVEV